MIAKPPSASLQASVRAMLVREPPQQMTICQLVEAYLEFCQTYYRKHGEQTGESTNVYYATVPLCLAFGDEAAAEFGPRKLKAIRQIMAEGFSDEVGVVVRPLSRKVINDRVGRVRRMFRWAVSEELMPVTLSQSLASVAGLRAGRSAATETDDVRPVDDSDFQGALPFMPPVVRDMAAVHRLIGCRTTEACVIRPGDIDTSGDIWIYRPRSHKTEHHGIGRAIYIGQAARGILSAYLSREPGSYCFSPAESEAARKQSLRAARKTKVQPSQRSRAKPGSRQPSLRYDKTSYARAVRRACDKAGIPRWHPGQLRHAEGTAVRKRFGLEAAQVILGHQKADVTQVYAERNEELAIAVRRQMG